MLFLNKEVRTFLKTVPYCLNEKCSYEGTTLYLCGLYFSKMEVKYTSEPPRSSEEEDELGRSVKKFKESNGDRQFSQTRSPVSYKDRLVGDIPGAYGHAFKLDMAREEHAEELDTEFEPLIEGMVEVKLSKESKSRIREPWTKALIVKVFW